MGETKARAANTIYDPGIGIYVYLDSNYPSVGALASANSFGGYTYYWDNGAGGSFTGGNWGGVSSYYNADPPYNVITVNYFTPPPGSHDNNDSVVFQGTSGLFMGVPVSSPDYGPASSTYTVVLNGSPTVHDTLVADSALSATGSSYVNLPASFTFSLAGTYTSTAEAVLDAQQVTFNNSGTFTTPYLSVSGQVTVNGGTLHGDITVIDSSISIGFFAGSGSGIATNVPFPGTTLTINGSNSVFEAPNYVEIGVSNNGPASLVLSAGATGTVGSIYLGLGGQGSEGDITINAATLTSNSFIDIGESAYSIGKVGIVSGGQLTTEDAAIGFGNDALGSATLNGSGSKWTINGFVAIGYDGPDVTSTLTVQNHAMVTSQDYLALGGDVDPMNGNLTGNGRLSISNGGVVISGTTVPSASLAAAVGFGPNSTGTVLIDGTGSLWDIKQRLDIGYSAGSTGTVTVQNGGTLQVEGDIIRIGRTAGSTGTLTFDGTGGSSPTLTFTGGAGNQLIIGDGGTGNFNVQGGAQITVGASVIIGNEGNTGMGSGTGNATVKGQNSSLTITGNLVVGEGGTGTLMIMNGDTVSVGGMAILGDQNGSNGTLTLDGAGSKLTLTTMGNSLMIGNDGIGTLTAQNGASVTLSATQLGLQADGSGVINVIGTGAGGASATTVAISGQLVVGVASGMSQKVYNGLFVSAGGQVTSGQAIIGQNANSYGVVSITDLNSSWKITNTSSGSVPDLIVGQSGTGNFTLANQANFTAGAVTLGQNSGGMGTVTIEGSTGGTNQTVFTTTGKLIIGDQGQGTFSANSGAQVSSTSSVVVGNQPGHTDMATTTDPGTLWTISGIALTIGNGGIGFLTVQNGATLDASSAERVLIGQSVNGANSQGTLTVTGANSTFKTANVYLGDSGSDGLAALSVTQGGQVNIIGSLSISGNSSNTILVDGKSSSGTPSQLTVGQIILASPIHLSITVSNQGILTVQNAGTLTVDGVGATDETLTITSGGQVNASQSTINLGLQGVGTLNVTGGGSFTSSDSTIGGSTRPSVATIQGGAGAPSTWNIMAGSGAGDLTISSGGTLAINGGGAVTVAGSLTEAADLTAVIIVNGANAVLTIKGQSAAANGTLNVMGGGVVNAAGLLTIGADATVTNEGSTLSAENLTIAASIPGRYAVLEISDNASANVMKTVTVASSGQLDVGDSDGLNIGAFASATYGHIYIGPGGSLKDFGRIFVALPNFPGSAPAIVIQPFGSMGGSGTVNGTLVSNLGLLAIGDPQTLTIIGNYAQGSTGTLELQIAGTGAANSDHLIVTGQATLGGYLELDFTNGFAPQAGQVFNLLSFGATAGQFAGVEVTGLAPGWTLPSIPRARL
jgi:T5SS/PEP-CTERM-associated repeat protein